MLSKVASIGLMSAVVIPGAILALMLLPGNFTPVNEPVMVMQMIDSPGSNLTGNLTRADGATIPALIMTLDDVLANTTSDNRVFITDLTQEEWEQIATLFEDLAIPCSITYEHEGAHRWYIYFEGDLLEVFLTHRVS